MLINSVLIFAIKYSGTKNKGASLADQANTSHRGPSTLKCRNTTYADMQITIREKSSCKGMDSKRPKRKKRKSRLLQGGKMHKQVAT